ncbi:MAG: methyltransferase domain-containing protein [Chlamydiales bacterium]
MFCLTATIKYVSNLLESTGLYEPELTADQAREQLGAEKTLLDAFPKNEWVLANFQATNEVQDKLSSIVEKAIRLLPNPNFPGMVAVDLGCGISPTPVHLLNQGFKVYAIDSSMEVLEILKSKVNEINRNWIEEGKLVLVHQTIENFEYPENVHLIHASESLPYCDPEKISSIFLKAKAALVKDGILACNFFPYMNSLTDGLTRRLFGGWLTTKNVVSAIILSVDFSRCIVKDGRSSTGIAPRIHVFAQG